MNSLNKLSKREVKILEDIVSGNYYMKPIIKRINRWVRSTPDIKNNWLKVLDKLYDILKDSQNDIEKILDKRVSENKIKDKDQARRSIAGSAFCKSIIYIFLINKVNSNIPDHISITSQTSMIPNFDQLVRIKVQDEFQKPDMDIVIYSLNTVQLETGKPTKYILLSLKTSLRERAAQTYKWKLLMEVALNCPEISEKYGISYKSSAIPVVCFATTNFYNEINNPQQRGILKFFDKAFIAKNEGVEQNAFVSPLSELIPFAIGHLREP